LDCHQDFFLIDTDRSNATTSNYYGSYKFDKQAFFSEAAERASTANPLLDAALLRPVVANCRAGTFLKFAHLAGNEKGAANGSPLGHSDAISVCE
jgi:hypothetical protein